MCRGREASPVQHPATAHLLEWFADLDASRSYTVIAGLGGATAVPNPIGYQELLAWAQVSGNEPTAWEIRTLRAMDAAWRAAYDQRSGSSGKAAAASKQHQGVGEYCKGHYLNECEKNFGKGLARVCATCPD